MKPLVLWHSGCWDGFCAAWVAHRALGDIEAKAVHYGTPAPDCAGRRVYIVDFSYPRAEMLRILGEAERLVVLDHHKTAEAELAGVLEGLILSPNTSIEFDMTKSGGRLAWEYFYPFGKTAAPWLVQYTEDRDLWRHALPGTEQINAALRSYPLSFAVWDKLEQRNAQSLIDEGIAIRRSEKQMVDTHVRNAHLATIDGHQVKVVNATVLFSEIAGTLAKGAPFGACYFDRSDGKRQWSLRSDDNGLDVSEIAKKFGGGGHTHSAGYEETL